MAEDFVTRWVQRMIDKGLCAEELPDGCSAECSDTADILRRFGRALIAVGARERTARERLLTGSPIIDAQRRALRKGR